VLNKSGFEKPSIYVNIMLTVVQPYYYNHRQLDWSI